MLRTNVLCTDCFIHGCRYKLSLLHNPGHQGAPAAVSFKDFATDKASNKAKKAAASSKGFGATAASKQAGTAAAGAAELTSEQLEGVLRCNAYGDDHLDGGLTTCRKEQQSSIIGACKATGWEQQQLVDDFASCASCVAFQTAMQLLCQASLALHKLLQPRMMNNFDGGSAVEIPKCLKHLSALARWQLAWCRDCARQSVP